MRSPFNAGRYARLLEGLNGGEERFSEMLRRRRIDSENAAHPKRVWLKSILESRHFVSLSTVLDFIGSGHTPYKHDVSEGDIGFVTVECIGPLQFVSELTKRITCAQYDKEYKTKRVKKGDVLCTIKRRICQAYAFTSDPQEPLAINQDIALLRPRLPMQPAYLATYLSCSIGQAFADRQKTEQMNPYISVDNLGTLPVYSASDTIQSAVTNIIEHAAKVKREELEHLRVAESKLISSLGLGSWQPSDPLTYTRRASEVFIARRMDSQYFAPHVAELLARLGAGTLTIGDMAYPRREKFTPEGNGTFRYIEISDVRNNGTTTYETMPIREAPSRASWYVHAGDVLTSTVRPIRRLSALVTPEQDGCVASSGFLVLQPQSVRAEVLLTYLRLPLLCELMNLHTSASLYPAINERDLLALPFPSIAPENRDAIAANVRSAHDARARAQQLLECAKKAVEIAIEDSESSALVYLEGKVS